MLMSRVVPTSLLLAGALAWPDVAHARDPVPQQHEVRVEVDASFGERFNGSFIEGTYLYMPESLNKYDEVVPALRRHVHQPTSFFGHLVRDGGTSEVSSTLTGGATGTLAGGHLYYLGELGFDHTDVTNDNGAEGTYWAMPARVELAARLPGALQLGGYVEYRLVLGSSPSQDDLQGDTHRSGAGQEFGAIFAWASPGDTIYLQARAGYRLIDWTFEGNQPGDVSASGPHGDLRLSWQTSRRMSVWTHFESRYDQWDNGRISQDNQIEDPLQNSAFSLIGDVGLVFWFEGKWGFRASLGGGYLGAPPLIGEIDRGLIRLGVGFTNRW
jgi:hypothetical protein